MVRWGNNQDGRREIDEVKPPGNLKDLIEAKRKR